MIQSSSVEAKAYLKRLGDLLAGAKGDAQLFEAIVNAPFSDKIHTTLLGLGIVVLLLVNKNSGMIDRIALSDTEHAKGAVNISIKRFRAIKIPVGYEENIIAKAIQTGRPQQTDDWQYLFIPDLTAEEARFNQAGAGIAFSVVQPLNARAGGALIFSYYEPPEKIGRAQRDFMRAYSLLVGAKLSQR